MRKAIGGHLLVEVLVGLGTMIPAICLVFGLFPVAHRMETRAWERWTACELAQEQCETLQALDFASLSGSSASTRTVEGRRFLIRQSVEERRGGRLKDVLVVVAGPTQKVELQFARVQP